MRIALGLLAAALAGAEGPPAPTSGAGVVSFQVRVLEMDGLGWRESIYLRLTPAGMQEAATAWTTSREIAQTLTKQARRVVAAPQLRAEAGTTATFNAFGPARPYVAHLVRQADGPVNGARAVTFRPETQRIREGFLASLSGAAEAGGVRIRLSFDDTRVASVHQVKLTEFVRDEAGIESYLRPALEVPEVAAAKVGGEWLIPHDGALVVSLGAQTVLDDQDEAVSVRERLVIVEPELQATASAVGAACAAPILRAVFVPMASPMVFVPGPPQIFEWATSVQGHATMIPTPPGVVADRSPMPPTPARSLPPAFDPDGSPVTLLPLPDDEVMPVATDGATAEPRPSPQTRHIPTPPPAADTTHSRDRTPDDRETGAVT